MGDAEAVVRVDDKIIFQGPVTPDASGAFAVDLGSYDGAEEHRVSVEFTNDAYGGTAATDRNLLIKDLFVDGVSTNSRAELWSNGTTVLTVNPDPISAIDLGGDGADLVSVVVSEDAFEGDAQFILTLDGQQVGGVQTAAATRSLHEMQDFTFRTNVGTAGHALGVTFLNDLYGGSPQEDRNLYVENLKVNGVSTGQIASLYASGTATLTLGASRQIVSGSGSQEVRLSVSEDPYQGNARFSVTIDGKAAGQFETTAIDRLGQAQEFVIRGEWGQGQHHVSVSFDNDLYGGSTDADRNLILRSVKLDGTEVLASKETLWSNGATGFDGAFGTATPAPTTPPASEPTPSPGPVTTPTPTPTPAPVPSGFGANSDVGLIEVTTPSLPAGTNILTVGAGKQFSSIAAAIDASKDGDAILVDSGTYTNDFAVVRTKIALYAVGGRVTMVATVPPPNYKGILTEETDLTVVGFDFVGARIPDEYGHNAAGIRVDGGNLVLINDLFTLNQNGVLTNPGRGTSVTIDHSVFDQNGGDDGNGAGNIHNLYVGDNAFLKATNSVFKNALVGHELKSRAEVNFIDNNLFVSGVGPGTGSYDIDLPDGGKDTVTNNTIIKGENAPNHTLLHFGGEAIPYAGSSLTVSGNLFQEIDQNSNARGIFNQTSITAQVSGNQIQGFPYDQFVAGPAKVSATVGADGSAFADTTLTGVLPGSTLTYTDADPHSFALDNSTSIQAVQAGAGHVILGVEKGHVIVLGGTGGIELTESPDITGGNQFTTVAGSSNTLRLDGVGMDSVDSEGTDVIYAGDGNQSGQLNGDATVFAGAGNCSWAVGGTASVVTSTGSNVFNVGADAHLTLTGADEFYRVDNNGGALSFDTINGGTRLLGKITGGAWSAQTYDGILHLNTSGGSTGADVALDDAAATIVSGGPDTIYAGAGDVTVQASGGATIYAGTGTLAVYTRGASGVQLYGAGGDYVISGDSGGLTYFGGGSASTVEAQVSNLDLIGGAGLLTVNGGARSTIQGGAGGIVFNENGGGANTVATEAGSTNSVNVGGYDAINSYGTDTIGLAAGGNTVNLYGSSLINSTAGRSAYNVFGTSVITAAGGGSFALSATARADITLGDASFVSASSGAIATFTWRDASNAAPSGTATLDGAGDYTVTTWPGQPLAVTTNSDAAQHIVTDGAVNVDSSGQDRVSFGHGASMLTVHGDGAEAWAGAGDLTVNENDWQGGRFILHGSSGTVLVHQNGPSAMTFIGGSGSATLDGGSAIDVTQGTGDLTVSGASSLSFHGSAAVAHLTLANLGSQLVLGSGATAVEELGYGAANTYEFSASQGGVVTVDRFQVGVDRLVLGGGVNVLSEGNSGGGYRALLSNGADVTLSGVSSAHSLFA